jgi:hypothetical protein
MRINANKNFCYRICHILNLPDLLQVGLCTKHHPLANQNFVPIGNNEIINVRDTTRIKIAGYGLIGEYVPFYFTPRSIMLYNIVTGHRAPVVPTVPRNQIVIIRSRIEQLIEAHRYFFTDGQANDAATDHFSDLKDLDKIDWEIIHNSNFSKDGDFDRPRRYQAEFLVHNHVPVSAIESIIVYDESTKDDVIRQVKQYGQNVAVKTIREYFF